MGHNTLSNTAGVVHSCDCSGGDTACSLGTTGECCALPGVWRCPLAPSSHFYSWCVIPIAPAGHGGHCVLPLHSTATPCLSLGAPMPHAAATRSCYCCLCCHRLPPPATVSFAGPGGLPWCLVQQGSSSERYKVRVDRMMLAIGVNPRVSTFAAGHARWCCWRACCCCCRHHRLHLLTSCDALQPLFTTLALAFLL
jgi:hypothetical protein